MYGGSARTKFHDCIDKQMNINTDRINTYIILFIKLWELLAQRLYGCHGSFVFLSNFHSFLYFKIFILPISSFEAFLASWATISSSRDDLVIEMSSNLNETELIASLSAPVLVKLV